jgi:hypothetical protein
MWERTLAYLERRRAVRATAERLGTEVSPFLYKQAWRGANVERWAAIAAEAGRTPLKLFVWLCRYGAAGRRRSLRQRQVCPGLRPTGAEVRRDGRRLTGR